MKRNLLFALIFCVVTGLAQEPNKIWTLKECIDYALQNNLNVKRSLLTMANSEVNLDQSKYAMLPSLNAGSSYGFNWGRSIDPTSNTFIQQRINSTNVNANSQVLLFNAFRLMNTYRQSSKDKDAAVQDLEKSKNDVILSVITLYLNVIFNKELLQNAQFQLNTTNQQLERTRKLESAGAVPRGNVLDLEAQAATNEVNLINRENQLNLSLLQLKQALQFSSDTSMDIEVPQIDMAAELVLDQRVQEIYQTALNTLPEVKSSQLKVESSALGVKAQRGQLYPRFTLSGNIFTNYSSAAKQFDSTTFSFTEKPFKNQFNDNISQSLSFGVSIPIFNGYSSKANLQRTMITNQQAEITLRDTENRLRQSVETAYNDAIAAAKTFSATQKQVNARDEAFRMTKQRFDNGAVNFVDYQVSENNLFQAKSDLVRAKYDFIFKKKVLDFYQNKPLEF